MKKHKYQKAARQEARSFYATIRYCSQRQDDQDIAPGNWREYKVFMVGLSPPFRRFGAYVDSDGFR